MNIVYDAAVRENEVAFCDQVVREFTAVVSKHNLNVSDIRFARKPMAFGSEGTGFFHLYTYRSGKVEAWVNLAHEGTVARGHVEKLVYKLVAHHFMKVVDVKEATPEMIAAFVGERRLKINKACKMWAVAHHKAAQLLA